MGILAWLALGFVAGFLAKWIMPGKQSGGIIMTIVLGIVGAFVGGFIGTLLGFGKVGELNVGSLAIAVVGAVVVLFLWGKLKK